MTNNAKPMTRKEKEADRQEERVYLWLRSQYPSRLDDEDKDYLNESNDLTDLVVETINSLIKKIQKLNLAALLVTKIQCVDRTPT
jgi:protease II